MKKISVIIPVWNTEKYVGECIDSILAQSIVKDLEIICVNDGSTDSSLEILRRYEKQYEQIKVIDRVNGGSSFARNAALEQTCGKYVYFMDSDDLLTSFALEELWNVCEDKKLDVLYFSGTSFYENQELTETHSAFSNAYYRKGNYKEVLTGEKMLVELRKNKDYMASPCLQIIRRNFLNEKNIRFYNGIIHEDNCFTFKTLLQAERTFCVNDIYFYRRVREQSTMTRQENWKNLKGYFCCLMDQMQLVGELNIQDIEVNKEIYEVYYKGKRKEQYFEQDLKIEHTKINKETGERIVVPSREDSFERLLEAEKQFAEDGNSVEDEVIHTIMVEKLQQTLKMLSEEENTIIQALFYEDLSETELAKRLGIARTTLQSRKYKILEKLKEYFHY